MALTSVRKYLFVVLILNQMLNIYAFQKQDFKEEIVNYTEYLVGNTNFTWHIADYSQIFDTVRTSFGQQHTSTDWELALEDKKIISLKRKDNGGPVFAHINFFLDTQNEIFDGETSFKFHNSGDLIKINLVNLDVKESDSLQHFVTSDIDNLSDYITKVNRKAETIPIVFENDVLVFKLKMKILGPETSRGSVNHK